MPKLTRNVKMMNRGGGRGLTVYCFAFVVFCCEHTGDFAPNISALHYVASSKTQLHHERVQNTGNILNLEITVQGWRRRERISD